MTDTRSGSDVLDAGAELTLARGLEGLIIRKGGTLMRTLMVAALAVALGGCTTVGSLGIVARSRTDAASLIKNGTPYKEVGFARGEACRYFLFDILPWGDADVQTATDKALASVGGGDALINVTTENSLYGFIPIYSIFTYTCAKVQGTAIRFEAPKGLGG